MKELRKGRQVDVAVDAFKLYKEKIATTEEWLASLAYCKTEDEFAKIGDPICDAIIFPKCPIIFNAAKKPYKKMEIFFTDMGLPVSLICQAAKKDCVLIQLEDARNLFTADLVKNIRKAVSVLTLRTYFILKKKGHADNDEYLLSEMRRLFARQFDFT